MRRSLLTLAAAVALSTLAPSTADARHPCLALNELTCWATSCHTPKFCL